LRPTLIGGIGLLIAAGCSGDRPTESHSALLSYCSRAVNQTLKIEFKEYKFEEAPLQGGTGVLLNGLGAYWVKDGIVYALNGLAASYSPGVSYGPPGLGKLELLEALAKQSSSVSSSENLPSQPSKGQPPKKPPDSPEVKKIENEVKNLIGYEIVLLQEEEKNPGSFFGIASRAGGIAMDLKVKYKNGHIISHNLSIPGSEVREAAEVARRPKERYYRDSKGAIISESETEDKLRQIRRDISSMPDNLRRAFMEGVLRALEEEWARIKLAGPISER